MKRILLITALFFTFNGIFAQENEKELLKKNEEAAAKLKEEKPNGWVKKGMFSLLANQATFNNWLAGGQSNVSGNIGLNYDFNYKSDSWNWDNKIIAGYGLTKIKGQEMQKSDDRFQFSSLIGKRTSSTSNWYYSAFFNFKTQFDSGFESGIKTSHFFSPAYFQFGPGMLWKKSDNLKVNFAPATSKLIVVHPHFTDFGSSFGVEQGKSTRYEFGAALNGYYKFKLAENVFVENILNLYSNYLDNPQNVDIDYTLNINMKINKFLSTNFAFQTIYDDNAFSGFQTRQVIGLGLNYGF
ncbi:DUF3078 domain-containing protein [Flavobacterium sp. SUN052]|uniref:DUF3078 domain-containing protein n=1 Tax=Flavobacterium sp. SUN052 TaxID=3002441 RepID=UPI00237DBBAF|nr:DUF3078 domain-containing protein [Flavobacterium sp. SUN052]MEC4003594.1 DUF3078 domain-containing protein [Flavobacterium sp. SUN052]